MAESLDIPLSETLLVVSNLAAGSIEQDAWSPCGFDCCHPSSLKGRDCESQSGCCTKEFTGIRRMCNNRVHANLAKAQVELDELREMSLEVERRG